MTLEKTKYKYMRIAICGSGWGAYIYAHRVQRVKLPHSASKLSKKLLTDGGL